MAIIKLKYENSKVRLNHVLTLIKELELCFCLHSDLIPAHNKIIREELDRMADFVYV
jgi:hypothetical protein